MAKRKGSTKLGETAKVHGSLLVLLRKAGCAFCPSCYCYMPPMHACAGSAMLYGPMGATSFVALVGDCHALPKAA